MTLVAGGKLRGVVEGVDRSGVGKVVLQVGDGALHGKRNISQCLNN